jgi:hypothetical protein
LKKKENPNPKGQRHSITLTLILALIRFIVPSHPQFSLALFRPFG